MYQVLLSALLLIVGAGLLGGSIQRLSSSCPSWAELLSAQAHARELQAIWHEHAKVYERTIAIQSQTIRILDNNKWAYTNSDGTLIMVMLEDGTVMTLREFDEKFNAGEKRFSRIVGGMEE